MQTLSPIFDEYDKLDNVYVLKDKSFTDDNIFIGGYMQKGDAYFSRENNKEDAMNYYINLGIKKLNNILSSNKKISYIDTYLLLNNMKEFFNNPNSHYPNKEAYQLIANEIIEKTLEK